MNSVTRVPETAAAAPPAAAPSVDVVVPVHNEQGVLPASIRRLHDYLSASLPLTWRIVIADNASTDETLRIGMALAEDLPNVSLLALREKGRGRVLRAAWERSDADVVCYMDADLSTDLRALRPLLAPSLSGHMAPTASTSGCTRGRIGRLSTM
jgi:cellulose synthase/poly-beta-1,6-N-acetylglucosamine synthase-like glycosyltransferase